MEKRALLAVVLSVAVFYIFSLTQPKPVKNIENNQQKSAASEQSVTQKPTAPKAEDLKQQPQIPVAPTDASAKDITVETSLYRAVFTTKGGALKSLTLKNYKEKNIQSASSVVIGADSDPSLLNLSTKASGFNLSESAPFSTDATSISLQKNGKSELVFNHNSGQGYAVRKTYRFDDANYGIKLETEIFNNQQAPIVGAVQHVLTYPLEPKVKDNRFDTAGSYIFADTALVTNKGKDVDKGSKKYEKNISWGGFADKYFLTAIVAEKGSIANIELKKSGAGFMEEIFSSPQFTVIPGQSAKISHNIFIGPKDIDILKAQGNSLVQSLDLGWFTVLAKPMLYTLKFFNSIVGNYGIAIIIITVILKGIFFPLTHKSYKSMKGMQKIQPEMNKIKEKFKNDRDGMNKAVMELYREHKVNPLGGCLPMVVQIPVFFALYKALMFSIELRHAPFFFWVTDLSDKDPYYVTPVIMGVTMFIQQKMTPSQMDPVQQKMMLALPVVFTFMFLSFPSGLVLYWLVNNILTIAQQSYINKTVK